MESLSSAAAARRFPRFSGAGIDPRRGNLIGEVRVCGGTGRGALRSEFGDDGHVRYYGGGPRFSWNREGRKEGGKAEIKKKLKMSRGLRNEEDFSEFCRMERRGGGEVVEGREKPISEAAEVLLKQLEELKAEEKELKRKIKEQKAKLKAERKKVMMDSESSSCSSSSESSDSECGEVIDMGRLRTEVLAKEEGNNAGTLELPNGVLYREAMTSGPSNVAASGVVVTKRIEVCMGKKCGNSGGPALLEAFKNAVGVVEGAVVECKCLGKCRDGPNVRVSNSMGENPAPEVDDSIRIPVNPLFIGVSLEDVDAIVAKYLGKDGDLGLNAA